MHKTLDKPGYYYYQSALEEGRGLREEKTFPKLVYCELSQLLELSTLSCVSVSVCLLRTKDNTAKARNWQLPKTTLGELLAAFVFEYLS